MTVEPFRAQPGPQTAFLSSSADIAIFGGAAFSAKTFALLLEPLRHIGIKGFGAVIFRRTTPQIRREGGLWDTSMQIYSRFPIAEPRESEVTWRFAPHGVRIAFAHMEHESNRYDWDSTQIPFIGFDQLESFTETQFWHLVGRNRSVCGVKPYIRATCNPDPDSWLLRLIDWWIGEDGYPIHERAGHLRWFARVGDDLEWADSPAELVARITAEHGAALGARIRPMSATFIPGLPDDNVIGLAADPGYMAKLEALPRVERERLRHGNWKIRPAAGDYFKREWVTFVDAMPTAGARKRVRSWDLASTPVSSVNRDPDWTVGVLMSRLNDDRIVIEHVTRLRKSAGQVAQHIVATAREDGRDVIISIPQDPGQAGKSQRDDLQQRLHGYRTVSKPETGDKVTRAGPFSSATEQGRVLVVRGHWLNAWMTELENFPIGRHKDDMDATSGGFNELMGKTLKGGTWGRDQEKELTGRTALLAGPPLRMMGGRRR